MINECGKYFKSPVFITMFIATLLRISLSQKISVWYPSNQLLDDQLLIRYANLYGHFTKPDLWALVKSMSYPLFLDFVHLTGLSYSTVLAMVWIVAALLMTLIFKMLTENKYFLSFVYLFVLFTPSAFDSWVGTRLYRNAIIAPFVLITFALMILIVVKLQKKNKLSIKEIVLLSIALGLVFTFTYYIKEDGIWLLPCLALMIFVSICLVLYRYIKTKNDPLKRTAAIIVILFLPLLIWLACGNVYKMINYRYFSVYEINTRTEGELGDFVNNIYRIASDNRTVAVWAPVDAIEKAFQASETLRKYPELKEAIFQSPWLGGDITNNPIRGDFLTWVLRSALLDTGIWETESQVEVLFKQINSELEGAFEKNTLEKENKLQITASAGGRDVNEILQLVNVIAREYVSTVFLKGYVPGGLFGEYSDTKTCEFATILINENLLPMQYDNIKIKEFEIGNMFVNIVFRIYTILNPCLILLTIFSVIYSSYQLVFRRNNKNKKNKTDLSVDVICISIIVILLGISLLYAFAIGWFMEFVLIQTGYDWTIVKFYSIGLVPMLIVVELFGVFLFLRIIKNKILTSNTQKSRKTGQLEKAKN